MSPWLQTLVTVFCSVLASSGFWAYMQRKDSVRTQTDKLLQGLAYDKIVTMGMSFIERGWLTQDEYEDYRRYLYDPYKALGGNGVTERVVAEVSNLPLRSRARYAEILRKPRSQKYDQSEELVESNGNLE